MNQNYTAVIKEGTGWWIGWIEEVPGVNCQEKTREELLESLGVTLKEALELTDVNDFAKVPDTLGGRSLPSLIVNRWV
jgi:predicted RNase H-like HicB family nuclease